MAKKERPEYEALVNRIASGELTRQQAADIAHEQTGLSKGTFLVWLSSSGASERLKEQRGSAGDNSIHSHAKNDPDKAKAYEEAVTMVLKGMSGAQAARTFDVNYQYLMRKVAAAWRLVAADMVVDSVHQAPHRPDPPAASFADMLQSVAVDEKGAISDIDVNKYTSRLVEVLISTLRTGNRARNTLTHGKPSNTTHAIGAVGEWDVAMGDVYVAVQRLAKARKALLECELDAELTELQGLAPTPNMQPSKEDAEGMAKSHAAALEALAEADAQTALNSKP